MSNNIELTEEDAADLQFPKGMLKIEDNREKSNVISDRHSLKPELLLQQLNPEFCVNCKGNLDSSYILCVPCSICICCKCFASGAEIGGHKNNHDYRIIRDNYVVFSESDWTFREEILLLDSLLQYGSCERAHEKLPNRTTKDIIEHYVKFYSHDNKVKRNSTALMNEPVVITPYRLKVHDSDDPPRFKPHSIGSSYLSGYNCIRSDFELHSDYNLEDLVKQLKPVSHGDLAYKVLTDLQCAIISSYNRRLKDRQRLRQIVRNHGLISVRRTNSWLNRYESTITRPICDKLIRIMQLCQPNEFDSVMEGLHRSSELKTQLIRLCDFRQKGIANLAEIKLYSKLYKTHKQCKHDLDVFRNSTLLNWKNSQVIPHRQLYKKRSRYTPLEISGMPAYEKLNLKERELCRTVRLQPAVYIDFRDMLVEENIKNGGVMLKTARRLLKMDVNKTRKLFDFLVKEKYINPKR